LLLLPGSRGFGKEVLSETEGSAAPAATVLFDETVELKSADVIAIEPHQPDTRAIRIVSVGSNTLFDRPVQPYEGHRIRIVSETDVEVETVVE
jgi:hypothetical protein